MRGAQTSILTASFIRKGPSSLLLLLCAVAGCSSTGIGNPGEISLAITNADDTTNGIATSPEAGSLLHVAVSLFEIQIVPCDQSLEPVRIPGPFVVDLVTGKTYPEAPRPMLAEGSYCAVKAPLTIAERPASMSGRSILLYGERADGVRVLLYASLDGDLAASARPGRMDVGEAGGHWLWGLRPTQWIQRGELGTARSSSLQLGRRVIVVDGDQFPRLMGFIRRRLGELSSIYEDVNQNGQLDRDERTDENIVADGITP